MTTCRACKRTRLHAFLPLGRHPLANGFLRAAQLDEAELLFPLDPHVCLDCGLIQVEDHVPAEYFRHYVYVPSASDWMQAHFASFAKELVKRFLPSREFLAVDIGCNDGLLLKNMESSGAKTLGIDPATNIVEMARRENLQIINEYFSPEVAANARAEHGPATVIVTTNTFHHVDDLDSFTLGVTALLADDGVFVIEVPHALQLVEHNEFDGIYHEHVSQFTVKAFVDLGQRFGLEVFDVQRLEVHGGSIRVFMRKQRSPAPLPAAIGKWLEQESERRLFSPETYDAFADRVARIRKDLMEILSTEKAAGKRIVGYGASARGNTLLNYYGIGTDHLDYLIDRNPLKQGLYSPGMHIPVFGPERLAEDNPDHILILAWNFADEIIRQQSAFGARGGRFILPLPEPQLLTG